MNSTIEFADDYSLVPPHPQPFSFTKPEKKGARISIAKMASPKLRRWFGLFCVLAFALSMLEASADSAIDLVAGFDGDRIEKVFPISNQQSADEAAKLLYRVRKVNPESFMSRHAASSVDIPVGDAVQFEGEFAGEKSYAVPDSLGELLGFDSISVISIDRDPESDDDQPISVIVSSVPADCKLGDRFTVIGMVVASGKAVVAAKMNWHPRDAANPSWQWLADRGVDMAVLPSLKTRDRRPLSSADTEAFYSIMAAAAGPPPWPAPAAVKAIDLLSDPNSLVANFITLPVEVVQVTRVSVTDTGRVRQLGRDHYYQVDTIGELGNVVVKIESADKNTAENSRGHSGNEPAIFENRYPVSIVMLELPDFLKTAIRIREGGDAVVSDVRARVQVDGFFFRLWSYETDYMKQFGDEKQFGPLLIAAKMQNLDNDSPDPMGVGVIGLVAAGVVGISMVGIFVWHRLTSASDARVRRKRRDKLASESDLSS